VIHKSLLLIFICVLTCVPAQAVAQEALALTGKVTDEAGSPLIGASVLLVGYALGAQTDGEGVYRFTVPAAKAQGQDALLKVSHIGYRSRTEKVLLKPGILTRHFKLTVDVLQLETMVVTGVGTTVSKEKLGVTIARVPAQTLTNSDEPDVISALSGKAANVEVTATNGDPGAGAYIRIRGANGVTGGTQPLFVVDGSPINNSTQYGMQAIVGGVTQQSRSNDLNPEDIESIEILKGAAAAAMFGSRAANGVVLITTKSGRPGKSQLSYKMSYSWDQVNKSVPLQRTYGQGDRGRAIKTHPLSWGPKLDGSTPTYDHAWEVFDTGHTFENTLTLSGGNESTTYYLQLGRTRQDGAIQGESDYRRNSLRFKGTQRIGPKFALTGNISFVDVPSNRIQRGNNLDGVLMGALRSPPDFNNLPYLTEEGFHRSYQVQNPTQLKGTRGFDNPFFVVHEIPDVSKVGHTFGNVKLDYEPLKWLNVSYTLGHDYSNDERRTVFPIGSSGYPDGRIIREKFTEQETDGNLQVSAVRHFAPAGLKAHLMLGQNLNHRELSRFATVGDGLSLNSFHQLGNASSYTPLEFESIIRTESYFAQASVDLYDQLYLTAGLRNDGSSTFGISKRRHWYPKVSGAWEFTKLRRLKSLKHLGFGKIRLAYGEAGQQPSVYTTFDTFIAGSFFDGWGAQNKATAFGFGGFSSDLLKGQDRILPQRTREVELGLDLGLFNNRIGLEATYYTKRTTDAIFILGLPPSAGYFLQARNAATLTNRGLELGLNLQPLNRQGMKWDLGAQYGRNRNRVASLSGVEVIFNDGAGAVEGYPLDIFYNTDFIRFGRGIRVDGVNIDDAYPDAKAGDLYLAADGYPVIDPKLRVLGHSNPDWTGSVRNTFTLFNRLQVEGLIDVRNGSKVNNFTKGLLYYYGTHRDTGDRETRMTFEGHGPGRGKSVPKDQGWYTGKGGGFNGAASQFLEDGGYVKLREVSLAYTLRGRPVKRIGLSSVEVRLSGRNLQTWTKFTGIDPENNVWGTLTGRGRENFNNPSTRSYVVTVRVNY